jgi:pimeloyl-ACP methyl ester carboxylesterase
VSVNGEQDRIAPPRLGQAYTQEALGAGSQAAFEQVPETGHVELIAPGTDAFALQAAILADALSD